MRNIFKVIVVHIRLQRIVVVITGFNVVLVMQRRRYALVSGFKKCLIAKERRSEISVIPTKKEVFRIHEMAHRSL